MALYIPDYEYINGKNALEELKGPEGDLIRYYVSENERYAKKVNDRLEELTDALRVIKSFIS